MIDKSFIEFFKLAHGFFNISMFTLFCWQAWIGFRIRRARQGGAPIPFEAVKRHRRAGPILALWGVLGFIAGVFVVLLDKGRVLEFPLHFAGGILVVFAIGATYLLSRRIAGPAPAPRNDHFVAGVVLLALYAVQVLIGLAILL